MDIFIKQLEKDIDVTDELSIEDLNYKIGVTACETLKTTYRRKVLPTDEKTTEAPWITVQLEKRKALNRERRKCTDTDDMNTKTESYMKQKKKVQALIKEETYMR